MRRLLLILLLSLLSSTATALKWYTHQSEAKAACESDRAADPLGDEKTCYHRPDFYEYALALREDGRADVYKYSEPDQCDEEVWLHEGGESACGQCKNGYVDAGDAYRFGPRCQVQQESEECLEIGEFYNPNGYCTTECSSGSAMNNICLLRDDDQEDRCGPDSDDFRGTIGHGGNTQSVCGDNSCPKGGSYGFEEGADGSYQATCFPPNTNPPECPAGSAVIMGSDKVSFQCESIRLPGPDDGNGDGKGDGSDGDSDGDGKADTDGIAGQLNDIKKLLGKGNTNTGNINETLKGLSNQLGEGVGKLTEAIGNIPGGGGGGNGGKTEIVGKDGEGITWSGEAIEMEIKDGLEELEAAQAEYETLIGNIRSEMASSIGSFSGGGGLQDNNITLFGHTFNAGLSKFGADLSIVGSVVLFAATFMALGIVMGARD